MQIQQTHLLLKSINITINNNIKFLFEGQL